jgi:hypothetical protein
MNAAWMFAVVALHGAAAPEATIVVETQALAVRDKPAAVDNGVRRDAVHALRASIGADGRIVYDCAPAGPDLRFTQPLRREKE